MPYREKGIKEGLKNALPRKRDKRGIKKCLTEKKA
jgi:hypothetical protein